MKHMGPKAKDYSGISQRLLCLLKEKGAAIKPEKEPWQPLKTVLGDVRGMIDLKRHNDGREPISDADMLKAISSYLDGNTKSPLAEEYVDALSNVRLNSLGLKKFDAFAPLNDKKRGV